MKVAAFLLPDKMIIETIHKKNAGTWYSSGEFTMLPLDTLSPALGDYVLNHLYQSKEKDISYDQIKDNWKLIIKKAKFKTEKAFLQSVRRVNIIKENNKIIFEPFKINTKQKMFYRMPDYITEIVYVPGNSEIIGKELIDSWAKCLTMP